MRMLRTQQQAILPVSGQSQVQLCMVLKRHCINNWKIHLWLGNISGDVGLRIPGEGFVVRRACSRNNSSLWWIAHDPMLNPLRSGYTSPTLPLILPILSWFCSVCASGDIYPSKSRPRLWGLFLTWVIYHPSSLFPVNGHAFELNSFQIKWNYRILTSGLVLKLQ